MIICSFKKVKFIYFTTIDKKQLIFIFFGGKDVSSRGSSMCEETGAHGENIHVQAGNH